MTQGLGSVLTLPSRGLAPPIFYRFISAHWVSSLVCLRFEQNVLSDSKLIENIYQLLKHQQVDDEASGLITEAINSMMGNNHALLLESFDVIWAIGLAIILWSFPYKVIFGTDE
jgi:hypothetical protein